LNKQVCFISNFYLTDFYLKIARNLASENTDIYWICPNVDDYQRLKSEWGTGRVLYIGLTAVIDADVKKEDFPADLQSIKSNDLLIRDRILKFNALQGSAYLTKLKYVIYNFFQSNNITHVFGELTWSHEVIINRICRFVESCNTSSYNPHTLRIPQQTFGFFLDEFQSNLSKHKLESDITTSIKDRYAVSMLDSDKDIPLPDYLKLNDKILAKSNKLVTKITRLINVFFGHVDNEDPTLETSKLRRIISGFNVFINAKVYNMIAKVSFDTVEKLPFYLYPLHKQPEASVDVIGKYYDDQLLNIRNISSQLKDDQYLLVKEHSNAIGDRGYKFYKQLNNYPRVLLVDEKVNTKVLMEMSLGVFTVSGTAALEASLKGISSYCFSAVYFRHLKSCNVVTLSDFNEQANCLNSQTDEASHLSNEKFVNTMLKSACDGIISNPRSDSRCVSAENITKVANEFEYLINKVN
jgi:hypothetical protein